MRYLIVILLLLCVPVSVMAQDVMRQIENYAADLGEEPLLDPMAVEEEFKKIDTNNDGVISEEEFRAYRMGVIYEEDQEENKE